MVKTGLHRHFDYYLAKSEIVIYAVLAVLLAAKPDCNSLSS
jgi:hypothetical protein